MTAPTACESRAVGLRDLSYTWPGAASFSISIKAFDIEEGEKVLLLGDSGTGKSTLLSLICGIFPPDKGQVLLNGVDLATLRSGQRDRFRADNVGVIFQMFNLLPYASAIDNVLLPVHFSPVRRSRLLLPERQAAIELLKSLGLSDQVIADASVAQLSVGQQQRVAVARALIGSPRLIVADEPTSSLDSANQHRFLDLLFENLVRAGSTLLMVSHDERLADRFDRTVQLSQIAEVRREQVA